MSGLGPTLPAPGLDPPDAALEQAAEWFALLRSGEAAPADQGRWQRWLAAAAEHREAWRRVEAIGLRFGPLQGVADPTPAVEAWRHARRRGGRRSVLLGLVSLAGVGGLIALALQDSAWLQARLARSADHRSALGQVRELRLADGSQAWLATSSALDEEHDAHWRRLRLRAGEVLVRSAADPLRPLVVDTPHGRLRALGTRFTVRLEASADGTPLRSFVAVYEGAVELRPRDADGGLVVPAGRQAYFGGGRLPVLEPTDPAGEAWTRGLLIAQRLPLAEVARQLQRYRGGGLAVAPEVAGLPVFGSYPLTEPDRALAMLASVMPIRVRRAGPERVWIEARP